MASTSTDSNGSFKQNFPSIVNGKLKVAEFVAASENLVCMVERLGTVFAPVKYDMQGNIDKIKKLYKYDESSCLFELMLDETANGRSTAAEGVLWLNRALLFFELAFHEILQHLKAKSYDVNMKRIFTVAYEGSVKKYHNWVTQQLFSLICKMSPTLPQLMRYLGVDNDVREFEINLDSFLVTLNLVRCKIDDFFRDNNLFSEISSQTSNSF